MLFTRRFNKNRTNVCGALENARFLLSDGDRLIEAKMEKKEGEEEEEAAVAVVVVVAAAVASAVKQLT